MRRKGTMRVIYKYELNALGRKDVSLPRGFKVLKLGVQRDVPVLWCLVDPEAPTVQAAFITFVTGVEFNHRDEEIKYIDSFQLGNLPYFVGHVFQLTPTLTSP
jgi:hypothetical protein